MIKSLLGACALVLLVTTANAQSGSSYDWQSGNSYNWNTNPYSGQTHLRGYNSRTGSMWNSTIMPNGNQRGFDSRGNSWNYNAQTGSYYNSNGRGCIGRGAARTCW